MKSLVAGVLLLIAAVNGSAAHATCYVKIDSVGRNDGSTWTDAYTNLQFALLNPSCAVIWVSKGVYKPVLGTDPSISFVVTSGISLIGGFAGNEIASAKPNPSVNITVLSGDIDGNDETDINHIVQNQHGTNSYHVLSLDGSTGHPITDATHIEGFVITGGNAQATTEDGGKFGGGLYCNGTGKGGKCNPQLANLVFSHNQAVDGGAIFNNGSSGESNPSIFNVVFDTNRAVKYGGAIYNGGYFAGNSSPGITSSSFVGNSCGSEGAAIFNDGSTGGESSPTLINDTFLNNSDFDATIYNDADGEESRSSPILWNVTMLNNSMPAMINDGKHGGYSQPTILNTIIYNDENPSDLTEIASFEASPLISYSLLPEACPRSATCTNLINAFPKLALISPSNARAPVLLPLVGSPAIDNGSISQCPINDQRGLIRSDGRCDIGAIEWQPADDIIFEDGFQ